MTQATNYLTLLTSCDVSPYESMIQTNYQLPYWQGLMYLITRLWHKLPAIVLASSDVPPYERMTQTAKYRYDAMDATGKATRNLLLDPKWDEVPYFHWRK